MSNVLFGKRLGTLALVTAGFVVAAMLLVFFYAPEDADQGFRQKIFYVHVPMAIVTLCGFMAAGIFAIKHLRTGDSSWGRLRPPPGGQAHGLAAVQLPGDRWTRG